MAKKKAVVVPVQKALPAPTGEAARERAHRAADDAWEKAQTEANRSYDMLMHSAWSRYVTALKAHGAKPSAGTDFDRQYDRERETALKGWKDAAEKADKKLDAALKAISET